MKECPHKMECDEVSGVCFFLRFVLFRYYCIFFSPKNKCAQYWPDVKDKLQGGALTIRHLEEKKYAEYIIRRFKLHHKMVNIKAVVDP